MTRRPRPMRAVLASMLGNHADGLSSADTSLHIPTARKERGLGGGRSAGETRCFCAAVAPALRFWACWRSPEHLSEQCPTPPPKDPLPRVLDARRRYHHCNPRAEAGPVFFSGVARHTTFSFEKASAPIGAPLRLHQTWPPARTGLGALVECCWVIYDNRRCWQPLDWTHWSECGRGTRIAHSPGLTPPQPGQPEPAMQGFVEPGEGTPTDNGGGRS